MASLPLAFSSRQTPEEFIEFIAPCAVEAQRVTGIPASVTIAQAALETGWGTYVPEGSFNYFGVKRGSWTGAYTLSWTREEMHGTTVPVLAAFRVYDSLEQACIDHALVFYNGRYEQALAYRRSPIDFARLIAPRYATDSSYAAKLVNIIQKYELAAYDLPLTEWRLNTMLVPERWHVWEVPEAPAQLELVEHSFNTLPAFEVSVFDPVDFLWGAFIVIASGLMGMLINPIEFKERLEARPGKQLEQPKKTPRFQEF